MLLLAKLSELTDKKKNLEAILADSSIYESDRKEDLQKTLSEQRNIQAELDETEMEWLEKSEILQQKESEFTIN